MWCAEVLDMLEKYRIANALNTALVSTKHIFIEQYISNSQLQFVFEIYAIGII